MHEVVNMRKKEVMLFGICNGFQILTETNLLPGALLRNNKLKFICKNVFVKTINTNSFTKKYLSKKFYRFPLLIMKVIILLVTDQIKSLQDNQQIVFQYCDQNGTINSESNPNGSFLNIAGITNKNKNILE